MTIQTILILAVTGLMAGILSGFVGVGGGIIIVPSLVFLLGMSQHSAQGTSLFVLCLPVVFLALFNYWKEGQVNWKFGLIIAITFLIGGFVGSKLSLKLSPSLVQIIFGLIMAYVSFRLLFAGFSTLSSDES
ncbi:MAG: sulfite exporter TauE/SafE family protein [Flavobacteriia bacterium]|nr:sulfite exporter TauE/SafE family protein [Flavobacteriia bacterium]